MKCINCGGTHRLTKLWNGYICAACEVDGALEQFGLISKQK